jgi:hypothetical protein
VVNLKWNYDGRGIKRPPPQYIEYVKSKRAEFIWLNVTTFAGAILVACTLSRLYEGSLSDTNLLSIVKWNFSGALLSGVVSYLA